MSSMFTWVDFAEDDRRKMADVIALFAEKDTRDELGLGGVRDTFADLLFPATSTIQTRARYFLFIPWVYQELERRRGGGSEPGCQCERCDHHPFRSTVIARPTDGGDHREASGRPRAGDADERCGNHERGNQHGIFVS